MPAKRQIGWRLCANQGVEGIRFAIVIHFDTNFLIEATVAASSAHLRFRAWASGGETLAISTIAWAEFLCGPLDATAASMASQIFPNPEPFLSADAILAANLFNQTGRRSRS